MNAKAFAVFGVAAALFRLSIGMAWGHSWYDPECCSAADCEMMKEKVLPNDGNDWLLPTGEKVPLTKTRPSLDGEFHWCRYGGVGGIIRPSGKPICLYVPQGGV